MSAYVKDILRTIGREKKRLIALMVITVLGVAMMTGLKAACDDLRQSADVFFDDQHLHDLTVLSTLGLTEDDVQALAEMEDIDSAEGQYSETVQVPLESGTRSASVRTFTEDGIDIPYVTEGRLPENTQEIVVTPDYLEESGKQIGDTLSIVEEIEDSDEEEEDDTGDEHAAESDSVADDGSDSSLSEEESSTKADTVDSDNEEQSAGDNGLSSDEEGEASEDGVDDSGDAEGVSSDDTNDSDDDDDDISFDDMDTSEDLEDDTDAPNFPDTEFTIVGTITDVTSVDNPDGSVSFRSSSDTDYIFYVLRDAVESDYYTAVNVRVAGAGEMLSFSDAYEDRVDQVVQEIETLIQEEREVARYQELYDEAAGKIRDAEGEMKDAFAEADQKIADARDKLADGRQELEDGEDELEEQAKEAADKIADARQTIEDGRQQLADGNDQLDAAEAKLDKAEKELDAGEKTLEKNAKKLDAGEKKLKAGKKKLKAGIKKLKKKQKKAEDQLDAAAAKLSGQRDTLTAAMAEQEGNAQALAAGFGQYWPADAWNTLQNSAKKIYAAQLAKSVSKASQDSDMDLASASVPDISSSLQNEIGALAQAMGDGFSQDYVSLAMGLAYMDAALSVLNEQESALAESRETAETEFAKAWDKIEQQQIKIQASEDEIASGRKEIKAARKQLAASRKELEAGRAQIAEKRAEAEAAAAKLDSGEEELDEQEAKANQEIADARQELEDGWADLAEGEQKLADNLALYKEKKEEAEGKIADAWSDLDEMEVAAWYVQTRSDLGGYSDITSDADCIEAVGTAFPIMFFIVAILISLTTIARMVEENRGLIGTYQALGFTSGEIRRKYVVYITVAVFLGGVLGNILGSIVLPEIIFIIFHTMYLIPRYFLGFNPVYGIGGTALFWIGILAAALITCRETLKSMPAELMRPKTPKSGSRIFLEYWSWLWRRMSFLNKVTARNLFRYKKRFLMTVCGIAGCTGILLCGFAIKDTVTDLMPRQYDYIIQYDILAVSTAGEDNEALVQAMQTPDVTDYVNLQISSVKLKNAAGDSQSLQLYVIPEGESLDGYINLCDTGKNPLTLADEGIYVTENAADVLGLSVGDSVYVQDLDLNQAETPVAGLVENYLGNSIFVTEKYYEQIFPDPEDNNAVLVHLTEDADDSAFAEKLADLDGVMSVSSTQELKDTFSTSFALINMVVYIVIVMAAALAFVVLFTLSTTNISERERELATIKVLGFYDPEVHRYVNKETLILTAIGILLGMPLGRALGEMLMMVLKLPSINFVVTLHKVSYLIAAVLSFGFALIVNLITNRVLDRVDPVEALKSVE